MTPEQDSQKAGDRNAELEHSTVSEVEERAITEGEAIEVWIGEHGRENLENLDTAEYPTGGKRCTECGRKMIYPA